MPSIRRMRRRLAALTAVVIPLAVGSGAHAQSRALILSEDFRTEIPESVASLTGLLAAQGIATDVMSPFPFDDVGDLSPYQCVFDLRVDFELDPVIGMRMQQNADLGRGLYLAGEHPVFAFRNDSITGFLAALGAGPVAASPFASGSLTPRDILEPTNPDHPLSTDCNAVSEVDYDGIDNGHFIATGNGTWVSGSITNAGMAAWGDGQLIAAPNARVVVALDVNWLATGSTGTFDWRVLDRTIPTQNRALAENMVQWLCVPGASCGGCAPRNHGFWHRACLGWGAIDPGRNGGGNGPGPSPQTEAFDPAVGLAADGPMAAYGLGACQALDEGPFSDERLAALRELATLQLNLKGKLLSTSCAVELHPVLDAPGLNVGSALAEMQRLIALGDEDSLKDARWIGEHVNNGEALTP